VIHLILASLVEKNVIEESEALLFFLFCAVNTM
jgi:hypothetical protein